MDQNQPLNLNYDEQADVLYVALGPPREAYCLEPEEGILLRVDPDSGSLVGFTILHFRRRLQEGEVFTNKIPLIPADLVPRVVSEWRLKHAA